MTNKYPRFGVTKKDNVALCIACDKSKASHPADWAQTINRRYTALSNAYFGFEAP